MPTNRALTTSYGCPSNAMVTKNKKKKKKPRSRRKVGRLPMQMPRGGCSQAQKDKLVKVIANRVACACSTSGPPVYYDDNATRCLPMKWSYRKSVSTVTTSGQFVVQIFPRLNDMIRVAATFSSAAAATWGGYADVNGYNASVYSSYRITSMCVRFLGSAAPTDSAGIVTFCQSSAQDDAFDQNSDLYTSLERMRLYQSDGMICVKPEGPEGRLHRTTDSTDNGGWPIVYVAGTGMQTSGTTSVGVVEVEISTEMHVNGDQSLALALQSPGPFIPQLEAAIDHAYTKVPSIINNSNNPEQAKKTVWEAAEDAAISLIEGLAPTALGALLALL